jgi:hypothetical protein
MDLTAEADSQANTTCRVTVHTGQLLSKLIIDFGDAGSYYLDHQIELEKKSDGRKKNFKVMKSEHKT